MNSIKKQKLTIGEPVFFTKCHPKRKKATRKEQMFQFFLLTTLENQLCALLFVLTKINENRGKQQKALKHF